MLTAATLLSSASGLRSGEILSLPRGRSQTLWLCSHNPGQNHERDRVGVVCLTKTARRRHDKISQRLDRCCQAHLSAGPLASHPVGPADPPARCLFAEGRNKWRARASQRLVVSPACSMPRASSPAHAPEARPRAASLWPALPPARIEVIRSPCFHRAAAFWARSSAVEHYLDMVGVTGSIPVAPTNQS